MTTSHEDTRPRVPLTRWRRALTLPTVWQMVCLAAVLSDGLLSESQHLRRGRQSASRVPDAPKSWVSRCRADTIREAVQVLWLPEA
jgi:hypothetical protein